MNVLLGMERLWEMVSDEMQDLPVAWSGVVCRDHWLNQQDSELAAESFTEALSPLWSAAFL